MGTSRLVAVMLVSMLFSGAVLSQSGRVSPRGKPANKAQPRTDSTPSPDVPEEKEAPKDNKPAGIKLHATLVTVPVVASDRNGIYISDLEKEEFNVFENDVEQEIVFFATISEPFHVVLMLDTSGSTREKLFQIQRAARAFVDQLQPADRVKIISFDDEIRDLVEFTSDRTALARAIDKTKPGAGTRLYDAVELAINSLRLVEGRKAIVIFTDGVDWYSHETRYDDNITGIEESDIIVYPIRYDTRAETEAMIRDQQRRGRTVDLGDVLGSPRTGRTPPTVPGQKPAPDAGPVPPSGVPPVILGPRRRDRNPRDPRDPQSFPPDGRAPGGRLPDDPIPDDGTRPGPRRPPNDDVEPLLDLLYSTADRYLDEMASRSGGRLHRADTLGLLPDAFGKIAAELRTQYTLGYYPKNSELDGRYRKIRVQTSRRGAVLRSRPGYRAPG